MATQKKLGLFALTSLVTGNMIGSGVFVLPADLARVGSISLYSWIFTAAGALLIAFMFSKISHLVTEPGGPYIYVDRGLGKFMGFQAAYVYWIYTGIGNVAITIALVGYLRVFFPGLADPVLGMTVATCVLAVLVMVNITGVTRAGMVQSITTVIKLIPLLTIAIFGWKYFHPEYLANSFNTSGESNVSAFAHASNLTLWAFMGIESATVPSGSVDNPSRNIPLATIIGTTIAAAFYMICSVVVMGMIPAELLRDSTAPFACAAGMIFGRTGELIVAAGAVISCFGCLNGWVLIQSQIAMTIADHGLFPKIFAKRNRFNAPGLGLVVNFFILDGLLWLTMDPNLVSQFQLAIMAATTACLFDYFNVAISEIILLLQYDKLKSNSSKIHSIIAMLAGGYCFWAFFGAGHQLIYYVMGIVMVISMCYVINEIKNQSAALNG